MRAWHSFIHPISARYRVARGRLMLRQFPDIRKYRICDLGGSRHFWEKVGLEIPPGQITIYNISASETASMKGDDDAGIRIVLYDGERIPADDGAFDLVVCNSVIEHVAPTKRAALAREMGRVAHRLFCQTPAFSFPIEPHFIMPLIHWLPRRLGFWLAHVSPWRLLSRPNRETIRSYWWDTRLLTKKELRTLFPGATIFHERVLGLTKSYCVVDDRTSARRRSGEV